MPERPHSRKVKIAEGTAEVKKGGRVVSDVMAREREKSDIQEKDKKKG